MDRLVTVLLGSLFTGGVALASPLQAPRTPDAPLAPGDAVEIRREVELGGPRLGVQATELTPELQEFFGSDGLGVLVSRVFEDSAADDAGLAVGDVVVGVGGEPVASVWDLREAVSRADEGEVVVEVIRGGRLVELTAALEARPDANWDRWSGAVPRFFEWDDHDHYRMADPRDDEFERLERHLEDLQERLEVEFESMHDRLDALEENEIGRPEVK